MWRLQGQIYSEGILASYFASQWQIVAMPAGHVPTYIWNLILASFFLKQLGQPLHCMHYYNRSRRQSLPLSNQRPKKVLLQANHVNVCLPENETAAKQACRQYGKASKCGRGMYIARPFCQGWQMNDYLCWKWYFLRMNVFLCDSSTSNATLHQRKVTKSSFWDVVSNNLALPSLSLVHHHETNNKRRNLVKDLHS